MTNAIAENSTNAEKMSGQTHNTQETHKQTNQQRQSPYCGCVTITNKQTRK